MTTVRPNIFITSTSLKTRSEKKFLKNDIVFGDVITLSSFIKQLVAIGTDEKFDITWNCLNELKDSDNQKIQQIVQSYCGSTLTLLNNTIWNLLSYFLKDDEGYVFFKKSKNKNRELDICFNLIDNYSLENRILKAFNNIENYNIVLVDHIIPTNSLELLFLNRIEDCSNYIKNKITTTKTKNVQYTVATSMVREANSVVAYINDFQKKNKVSLDDIVITASSESYLEQSIIPILESQKIKFINAKRKNSINDTELFGLFISLYKLIIEDYNLQSIIDVLFHLKSFKCKKFSTKDINMMIFLTLKYGASGKDYLEGWFSKGDYNYDIDHKRVQFARLIFSLANTGTSKEVIKQIVNIVQTIVEEETIENHLTPQWIDFFSDIKTTSTLQTNKNSFYLLLKDISKNIKINSDSLEHEEGIVLSVFDGIATNASLNIFIGIDQNNFNIKLPNHLIMKSREAESLYSFLDSVIFQITSRVAGCSSFNDLFLTYSELQGSSDVSSSYIFSNYFSAGKRVEESKEIFLKGLLIIEEEKKRIGEQHMRDLYAGNKNSKRKISASSINRLFQCNYHYHLLDGIGLNKYSKVRVDNLHIGTWIHEILEAFFSDKYIKTLEDRKNIEQVFSEIARSCKMYLKFKQYRVCSEDKLNFYIYYLQQRLNYFLFNLNETYKKSKIKIVDREFEFGTKNLKEPLWERSGQKFFLRGAVDQVLKVTSGEKPFYLIIDFKASSRTAGLTTFPLLKDVQIPLYIWAMEQITHEEVHGGFYVPYYIKPYDQLKNDQELQRINNYIVTASKYATLNQNWNRVQVKPSKVLELEELGTMIEWMIEQIKDKFIEVEERGVIDNIPLDEKKCKHCRFQTFCGIRWESQPNKVEYSGTKSIKALKEMLGRTKVNKSKRETFIRDYKVGM